MPRKTQLNVVTSDPQAEQEQSQVYELKLLVEHYPAFHRWEEDKSDENLVNLFEALYPGAKKLDMNEMLPLIEAFRKALDAFYSGQKK